VKQTIKRMGGDAYKFSVENFFIYFYLTLKNNLGNPQKITRVI